LSKTSAPRRQFRNIRQFAGSAATKKYATARPLTIIGALHATLKGLQPLV